MIFIYYALATILLSALDAWRIKKSWSIIPNINHAYSRLYAAIAGVAIYAVFQRPLISWMFFVYLFGFVAIRGVLFDLFENLFRREKLDYQSKTSDNLNDQRLTYVPFWIRRLLYTILLVAVLLIDKYLIK